MRSGSSRWRERPAPMRRSSTARRRSKTGSSTGHEIVGLTAGASTPEELVQSVLADLAARGYADVEEVTVAREDVHFRLPKEVVA